MSTAHYWAAIATALQGQIAQSKVVQDEHRTPIWVQEYVGTGHGAPRFRATTTAERDDWRTVAQVDPDGTVHHTPEGVDQ